MQKKLCLLGALEGTIMLVTVLPTWVSSSLQGNRIICMEILIYNCMARWMGQRREKERELLYLTSLCSEHPHIQRQNHCDKRREMYSYKHNRQHNKLWIPEFRSTAGLLIARHNLWEISQKCCTLPTLWIDSGRVMNKKKFNLVFQSQEGMWEWELGSPVWIWGN